MSDIDYTQPPTDPAEPVRISVELPAGLVRPYDGLVEDGIYPTRESALLHAIVESWRHNRVLFHTIRLDLGLGEKPQDDKAEPLADGSKAPEG